MTAAPVISIRIEPVEHLSTRGEAKPGTNVVTFEAFAAEFHDRDVVRFGLEEIFAKAQPTNEVYASAMEQSAVMQLKREFTNMTVMPGKQEFFAGKCTEEEAAKLLGEFGKSMGVDLLSAPKVTTFSGRDAQIAVQDMQSIAITPTTIRAVPTGIDVALNARGTAAGTRLKVAGTHQMFAGYPNAPAPGTASPRFVLLGYGIDTEIGEGEVLIFGTPVFERVVKTVERRRYLGSIPVIGDVIFTRRGTETNRLRQVTIVRQVR